MRQISVAFVDDHPVMVTGLTALFRSTPGFEVVAKGTTAEDAIQIASALSPDILVMDINLQGNALEAIERITAKQPATTRIVVFTASSNVEHAMRALDAGAKAYILKRSAIEEMTRGLRAVHDGETYLTPGFATAVITALRTASVMKTAAQSINFSVREAQIVQQLLVGRTNKQIAAVLALSEKTIKHYMTVLMQKMQARNRLELVIHAQRMEANGQATPQ